MRHKGTISTLAALAVLRFRSLVIPTSRYEGGRLSFETDYVRGRMMKTDVTVFPEGRFTITTTNRGEAASRWVAKIQGEKIIAAAPT